MRAASLGVMSAFDEPPDFPDPLFPIILITSFYVKIEASPLDKGPEQAVNLLV